MKFSSFTKPAAICALATTFLVAGCGRGVTEIGDTNANGTLTREVKSEFSHIRVRENGSVRSMLFVEPDGLEVRQSAIDLKRPGELALSYTRAMFASLLFKHPQERVLVVGLGGGSMVRFLNHHFPDTRVDAVEIDPAVVTIAEEVFGTRESPGTKIFTEDAFKFLARDQGKYDAIYMDAFLEPGEDTDARGIPKRLKTIEFLKGLRRHLGEGGVVAFNLAEHPGLKRDFEAIAAAFPVVYTSQVPGTRNHVVIASPDPADTAPESLREAGRELDRTLRVGVSFERAAEMLKRVWQ